MYRVNKKASKFGHTSHAKGADPWCQWGRCFFRFWCKNKAV